MGIKTRNFANNILSGGTIDGTDFLSGTLPSSNITNDSAASVTSIPSISNVVSTVAGDPPSPTLGDIWYNSSTNALKFQGFQTAAWATGTSIPTATNNIGSFGSQTAALAFNGENPPGINTTQQSLSYDGTSWTATNPTGPVVGGQGARGAGTLGAGIASSYNGGGGTPPGYTDVKEWDGTSWTVGTSHNNRCTFAQMASAGTQTSTAIFGGTSESDPSPRVNTEEWDGATWTNGGNLNNGRGASGGSGTLTSSICVGSDSSPFALVEEYDGTSWAAATAYPSAPSAGMRSTGLTQDETLAWHLGTAATYNGTSWTAVGTLSTPRTSAGGAGSFTVGLAIGGTPNTAVVEEFTGSGGITKTFTTD
jgi:hypothetical protein